MGETFNSRPRREAEGFFEKYCQGRGLDIGCGDDPLFPDIDKWDLSIAPDQEATYLRGVPDGEYDFVYSSHCLEHLDNPWMGLKHWWRVLKPGGFLIVIVPHRDLYEKKKVLPSDGNPDHRWYFLPARGEEPVTLSLIDLVNVVCWPYDLAYLKTCEAYNIECVLRKG